MAAGVDWKIGRACNIKWMNLRFQIEDVSSSVSKIAVFNCGLDIKFRFI